MVVSKKTVRRTVIILLVLGFLIILPFAAVKIYFAVQNEKQRNECIKTYGFYLDEIRDNYDRFCEFSEYLIEKGGCDYNYEVLEGDYYDVVSLFHEPEITVEQTNGCDYVVYRMFERHYSESCVWFVYVSDPDNFRPEQTYFSDLKHEYKNVWGQYWVGSIAM